MGMPAAKAGDMHLCPKVEPGPVPHVGGPILPGSSNVFINGVPAVREGDMAICVGPPDKVNQGSASVFINGKPAARTGDSTAHGGKIVMGSPNVFIGDAGWKDSGQSYGGKTLSCGGRDGTNSAVYKDPATAHLDSDVSRKAKFVEGVMQPLEGTNGKPKRIPRPKSDEPGQIAERIYKGKKYLINKDENLMPEFTIFETYIDDEHINSGDNDEHFRVANKRLGELLLEKPELKNKLKLTEEQIIDLTKTPASSESPDELTWHHHQDTGKMQLVNRALHKRFGHIGGMERWGGGRK